MTHDKVDPALEEAFEQLGQVPAPDTSRQADQRAMLLEGASRHRAVARRRVLPRARSWALAGALLAILLVLAVGVGGVAYAADGAVPGDTLYGMDRALEYARLELTKQPQASAELLLSLAAERLAEAEKLSAGGGGANLDIALGGYRATISLLAQTLGQTVGPGAAELAAEVDQALAANEDRLAGLPQDAEVGQQSDAGGQDGGQQDGSGQDGSGQDGGEGDGDQPDPCVGADPHPVGQSLAEAYGLDYETIMGWFCDDGFGMGEIMHALETSDALGLDPGDVLGLRADQGWGQIWQELGMKGKPHDMDGDDGDEDQNGDDEPNDDEENPCVGADPHPVGQRLADAYELDYDVIMDWFCNGNFGMGEIKHALETGDVLGMDPEDILGLRADQGWGQIWQDLGLKGKPDDEDKMDKEDKPGGPPDDKDKIDKEDKPGGPPDDKDKADKEDKPGGPPDDKEKKDKKDNPPGPPQDKGGKDKKDKKGKGGG
jgi:hypothetical protein